MTALATEMTVEEEFGGSGESESRQLWKRLRRKRLAMISIVVIAIIYGAGLVVPFIAPRDLGPVPIYNFTTQDLSRGLEGPSADHWLGTDRLGRDMLSRVIFSARTTLIVTLAVILSGTLILGNGLGLLLLALLFFDFHTHVDAGFVGLEGVQVGQGFELTKDWFMEARLHIAARCVGAATRAIETANEFASERVQFGRTIRDFQSIEFMLADMAVEIMAAKSMLYRVCGQIDSHRSERKRNHAHASAIKLFCSEMGGRVLDRAVQILGGRGYMRENPVERLNRDIRVERIWEGTSEIQRVIIGGQIKKRGTGLYTEW